MTTGNTDIDTLAAEAVPLTLASGREIKVERLRTRALMSMLKILTRGASEVLSHITFGSDTGAEAFTGQLLGAFVLAIPEADDETIDFVNRMVSPAGIKEGNKLSKVDIARNAELEVGLRDELRDPDLDDLLTIFEQIIRVEGPHILALGKRLSVLIQAQQINAVSKQGASSTTSSAD